MSWIDILIIGIILLSSIISLVRGFISEALSCDLGGRILGGLVLFRPVAEYLVPWIDLPSIRLGVSYGLLLLATLIVGGLVNRFMGLLVDSTGLTGTDRLIGVFFGAARGVVVVAILVLLAGLTPMPNDPWWRESHLIPYFQEIALWLREFLPSDIASNFRY